ncbi:antitoxin Xre/MbcA/ParS toxin-binding domain-containing protein [Mesorhizobium mediterraneum]|uniref:antitoxin Xre/MbcA/ParS toxin-binding domain-containing protein n=1 Tax=Mesorhizobium mediterraneum TaxID=43617 RepID=UPI0017817544
MSQETFEDSGKANRWLHRELAELGDQTPLTLAQIETGGRGLVPYRPIGELLIVVPSPILQLFEPLWPDSR